MDLRPPFRRRSALTGHVGFIDYGSMKNIAAQGELKMICWVVGKAQRFHCGKFVDCCEYLRDCRRGAQGLIGLWRTDMCIFVRF